MSTNKQEKEQYKYNEETYGMDPKMKGMNIQNPQSGQVDNPTTNNPKDVHQVGSKKDEGKKPQPPVH